MWNIHHARAPIEDRMQTTNKSSLSSTTLKAILEIKMLYPDLMVGKKSHSLHLVEDRIVACVDLVPPVDVPSYEKTVKPGAYQLLLVCGGVCTQHVCLVQVVVVTLLSARVVFGDEQAVEVLLHWHHWAEVIMDGEERRACSACVGTVKMLFYAFLNDPQWMMRLVVKPSAHHGQDFSRHVGHIISWEDTSENFHRSEVDLRLGEGDMCGKAVPLR